MNAELREQIVQQLLNVAPDIDANEIDDHQSIREQFEFDSMDHLNFMIALHELFSVAIPEADYHLLQSIEDCIDYIQHKLNR